MSMRRGSFALPKACSFSLSPSSPSMTHAPPNGSSLRQLQRAFMLVLEEGRAHADPEFVDLHTAAFCGDEMSELMHDDQYAEGEDCQNDLQQSVAPFGQPSTILARGFVRRQNVVQRNVLLVRNGIEWRMQRALRCQ